MNRTLHIVMHDVPWPADFGGVVDLYYKLVWLKKAGIKIKLHCFLHKRPPAPELEALCESVHYYKRKTGVRGFSFRLPYIVSSRINSQLYKNLVADDHPVLLEGIHCSWLLKQGLLKNRKLLLRLHNVEYSYYNELARNEVSFFKKIYFRWESRLLLKYERSIARKAPILTVSETDALHYNDRFGADARFLPVFLPWNEIRCEPGTGNFCLYHGNLSVNENERVAEWLLNEIFPGLDIPLVVAGKGPSAALTLLCKQREAFLAPNPTEAEMQEMIRTAQLHILPSFNKTGVKLKLLNALYNGRHCLVNNAGVAGSGVESLCYDPGNTNTGFIAAIQALFHEPFTEEHIRKRQGELSALYNNRQNAERLIALLY